MPTDPIDAYTPLPDGVEAKTRQVMDDLVLVPKGLGLGLEDLVSVRIFVSESMGGFSYSERCL